MDGDGRGRLDGGGTESRERREETEGRAKKRERTERVGSWKGRKKERAQKADRTRRYAAAAITNHPSPSMPHPREEASQDTVSQSRTLITHCDL